MNTLLVAVNAKYIHSNLAVYSLQTYGRAAGIPVEVAEYTINNQKEAILRDIYQRKPEFIGISCYIWNMELVAELTEDLHQLLPDTPIWLGGPEVTWNPKERLIFMPWITGIMMGEGEETLVELVRWYLEQNSAPANIEALPFEIPGLCIRVNGVPECTAARPLLAMDLIPFPYKDLEACENRIIYYESSRGCPFSCSYCLSSVEKALRFRSLALVYQELDYFLQAEVLQVKFVDRTFNCNHEHAYGIWSYITEHDNGKTNFHFEISADLLKEEDFALFARMRPGLIQLETGVQTTNSDTIQAIGRRMNLELVAEHTKRIRELGNIHQHLDLIAGLPHEDLNSFARSFDQVYDMGPDELQLGFLKVLHGTRMEEKSEEYGLIYSRRPVYEIMGSNWLTYEDILHLKNVEDAVEVYYNSNQYANTLAYIMGDFLGPFDFFSRLGAYREAQGVMSISQSRMDQYQLLRDFMEHYWREECTDTRLDRELLDFRLHRLDGWLSYDYCLRERLKRVPAFMPEQESYKKLISDFYAREVSTGQYFGSVQMKGEGAYRRLRGRTQALVLSLEQGTCLYIFDYENRSPLDHNASVLQISLESLLTQGCLGV